MKRRGVKKGVTLIELLIIFALIGIVSVLFTSYNLRTREKNLLITEQDKIIKELRAAQQRSISAEEAFAHGVEFESTEYTLLMPTPKTIRIARGVEIESGAPTTVIFSKLEGLPETGALTLVLATKSLECKVEVSVGGNISGTNVEKK